MYFLEALECCQYCLKASTTLKVLQARIPVSRSFSFFSDEICDVILTLFSYILYMTTFQVTTSALLKNDQKILHFRPD